MRTTTTTMNPLVLWILGILQTGVAIQLNVPLFEAAMDNIPLAGILLAPALGIVEAVLSSATGKVAGRGGQKGMTIVLLILGAGFLGFIYYGQFQAAEQQSTQPQIELYGLITDDNSDSSSSGHLVASALITLLYILSIVLNFIYYRDEAKMWPYKMIEKLTRLIPKLIARLNIFKNKLGRANEQLRIKAENKVNKRILTLQNNIKGYNETLEHNQMMRKEELKKLNNLKNEIIAAIKRAYGEEGATV